MSKTSSSSKRGHGRPRTRPVLDPDAVERARDRPKKIDAASMPEKSNPAMALVEILPEPVFNLKDPLTEKELKFIEIRLSGNHSIDNSMILGGYGNYHQDTRYRLVRKIVQKYESQAGDHREIFRSIELGELRIAKMILDKCLNAKSEVVQMAAITLANKCLGLTSEVLENFKGIQINLIRSGSIHRQTDPERPAAKPLPEPPLQITK